MSWRQRLPLSLQNFQNNLFCLQCGNMPIADLLEVVWLLMRPGANVIDILHPQFTNFSNKLERMSLVRLSGLV
jgi:hypothetical protein